MVHKNDGITRVEVEGKTYELHLGDKTKDGYQKIKVMDNKNYILLTYLARDLAKCPVVWIEELREICVVKGEYLGNGLVKGKSNYLMNVYGEQMYTVRNDKIQNTLIPVYARKKGDYYVKGGVGPFPANVSIKEHDLIMPKSSWNTIDLSLTPMEKFHGLMDLLSIIPVIGIGADIANATSYAMEKEYVKMGLYLGFATISIIPLVSQSSKTVGIKLTNKEGEEKLVQNAEKISAKEVEKIYVEKGIIEKEAKEVAKKLTLSELEEMRIHGGITLEGDIKRYISLVDKTVNKGKQGKHILGHNNYREGKSYITISINEVQELVDKYAGTGNLEIGDSGKWTNKELVNADKIIGVAVSGNVEKKTSQFKIHYSNKGVHIVPFYHD